jgi:hypothetical protein
MTTLPARLLILFTALAMLFSACSGGGADDGGKTDFDGGDVRIELAKGKGDAASYKAFFVATEDDADLEELARTCVESFADEAPLVQCWSFRDRESFDRSEVDEKTGKMLRSCWSTYAAKMPGRDDITTDKLRDRFREQYQCDREETAATTVTDDKANDKAADEVDDSADEAPADGDAEPAANNR